MNPVTGPTGTGPTGAGPTGAGVVLSDNLDQLEAKSQTGH